VRSLIRRLAIPVGLVVALAGIVASTSTSGFIDSLIFWGIVGTVIAAVGSDLGEDGPDYR
jgi:hypothetical protein